jgi:hypothetical protein
VRGAPEYSVVAGDGSIHPGDPEIGEWPAKSTLGASPGSLKEPVGIGTFLF